MLSALRRGANAVNVAAPFGARGMAGKVTQVIGAVVDVQFDRDSVSEMWWTALGARLGN